MKYVCVTFILLLLGASCLGAEKEKVFQSGSGDRPPNRIEPLSSITFVVKTTELLPNSSYAFRYGNTPATIVKDGDKYIAYLNELPRPGCALFLWQNVLKSPCTGSIFDPATGAVLIGPASEPLKRVELIVRGESIFVVNEG